MRTAKIKIYTFSELSETAKEKAMNNWRENDDMPFLEDDVLEKVRELCDEHGVLIVERKDDKALKVAYSLSYSQGDFLEFSGLFEYKGATFRVVTYDARIRPEFNAWRTEDGEQTTAEQDEEFQTLYYELCRQAKKFGYSVIEAEQDEKNISEMLSENEYEFLESGALFTLAELKEMPDAEATAEQTK